MAKLTLISIEYNYDTETEEFAVVYETTPPSEEKNILVSPGDAAVVRSISSIFRTAFKLSKETMKERG